jgi:predicted nucleic acid-binding protein
VPVFYLETSSLLKKSRSETGTEVISELFSQKEDSEVFITSFFTLVEVTSVATRLLRARSLTQRAYLVLMGNLAQDAREKVLLQSVTDGILSESINLAQAYALRAPDAIHLASALDSSAAFPEDSFFFMGSDSRLNVAAESSGLTILNPETPAVLDSLRNLRTAYS